MASSLKDGAPCRALPSFRPSFRQRRTPCPGRAGKTRRRFPTTLPSRLLNARPRARSTFTAGPHRKRRQALKGRNHVRRRTPQPRQRRRSPPRHRAANKLRRPQQQLRPQQKVSPPAPSRQRLSRQRWRRPPLRRSQRQKRFRHPQGCKARARLPRVLKPKRRNRRRPLASRRKRCGNSPKFSPGASTMRASSI